MKTEITFHTAVKINYKNHRGEEAVREVRPDHIWFGVSEWHAKDGPQFFLNAWDYDKRGYRDFAMKDVSEVIKPDNVIVPRKS